MSLNLFRSLLQRHAKQSWPSRNAPSRGFRDHEKDMRRSLYHRRMAQGPEPERPASAWINWNYDMEVSCFGRRLKEEFQDDTLKQAFVNRSYVESEERRREEVGVVDDDGGGGMSHNQELCQLGEELIEGSLSTYFSNCHPRLPMQAIKHIVAHLSRDHMLSHIAHNLGVKDLVLSQEFPPSEETMSTTFKAVVGALCKDQGKDTASIFVRDLIGAQMTGVGVDEVWVVDDPMKLLVEELHKMAKPPPEPRVMWSSGSSTILSNYVIGLYCQQTLIGQSSGESVMVAEEMAARDALRNIYHIQPHHQPLTF